MKICTVHECRLTQETGGAAHERRCEPSGWNPKPRSVVKTLTSVTLCPARWARQEVGPHLLPPRPTASPPQVYVIGWLRSTVTPCLQFTPCLRGHALSGSRSSVPVFSFWAEPEPPVGVGSASTLCNVLSAQLCVSVFLCVCSTVQLSKPGRMHGSPNILHRL